MTQPISFQIKLPENFEISSDQYVFRCSPNSIVAEKKGVWTWIKSNLLAPLLSHINGLPNPYKLTTILTVLKSVASSQGSQETSNFSFISDRIDLNKYIKNHPKESETIKSLFEEVFPRPVPPVASD